MPGRSFLDMLSAAGFQNPVLHVMTGFKSSPVTEGAVFSCRKPE